MRNEREREKWKRTSWGGGGRHQRALADVGSAFSYPLREKRETRDIHFNIFYLIP